MTDDSQYTTDRPSETVGTTIGPYRLLEQIGEGGMGVVFMAEQTEPVRRKVALKIIKPGMDTKRVIARFEAERQALALMDHPNIARVLDAGTTESNLPYFVMELVRGIPITDYCDQNKLTTNERLELFVVACQAVQHAHTKGIIHRDIKPSNVLVTLRDGVPMPKIIDFGLARATNQQLTDKTLFTAFAQMVGTPIYMSPEQAEMSSLDIDTRSDIYSLGVMLYELLTGATPLDDIGLDQPPMTKYGVSSEKRIPAKPSTKVSTIGDDSETVAAKRSTDANKLRQRLRGELDWIVLKSLEKDRTRRYQTASDFAQDVRRHLSGEAVQACPPTLRYRATKFVSRYRAQVGVASTFVAMLAIASIVSLWLFNEARQARDDAKESEEVALAAKDEADRQRDEANKNLRLADERRIEVELSAREVRRQLRLATVQQLAAQAQAARFEFPVTSALLAARSVEMCKEYDQPITASAHESLVSALSVLGGEPIATADASVTCLEACPDGSFIAAGSRDGSIQIFTPSRQLRLESRSVAAHTEAVRAIAVAPTGRVFSVGGQGVIKGWDFLGNRSPNLATELPCPGDVSSLAVSPDDNWLAAACSNNQVIVWDLTSQPATSHVLQGSSDGFRLVRFTSDSKGIVAAGGTTVEVWAGVESANATKVLRGHTSRLANFVIGEDGQWIVTASWDGSVRLWDLSKDNDDGGTFLASSQRAFEGLAASPNSRWVAAGCDDQAIWLWDLKSADPVATQITLRGHTNEVRALAFSGDGRWLISASDDKTLRLWDLELQDPTNCRAVLRGHESSVRHIETDRDGKWIVSGGREGTLRRWDLSSQNPAGTLPRVPAEGNLDYDPYYVTTVAFSQNDRFLAAGDMLSGIRVWPMDNLESSPTILLGHTGSIDSISFSPLGRFLFSLSRDGSIRKWDISNPISGRTRDHPAC